MNKYSLDYNFKILKILKKIIKEENKKISNSAKLIKKSYLNGGQLYIFGTGHSHMMAEESFHRAGGYAGACPILDKTIDFSLGAEKATKLERTPKVASNVLKKYKITKKDIIIIFSNSGVNHAPVEAALFAKKKNIKSIAILSYKYSKIAPLSLLGKRLFEITDLFIDNKIPIGDSVVKIDKKKYVGPASTIVGSFILNLILVELAGILKNESEFPFYISSNMQGAKDNNDKLIKKYIKLNPHL